MKIVLLTVGKTDAGYWADALADYELRLRRYVPFEHIVVPDVRNARSMPEAQLREAEGVQLLKAIEEGDCCLLLDERGHEFTSTEFAACMEKRLQAQYRRLVFVVGGPYGFSEAVYQRANERIALSRMTFSHQMVRAIFIEQLYRAMTIIRGEKYHHGAVMD